MTFFKDITLFTKVNTSDTWQLCLNLIDDPYWFPAKRDASRSYKHSIEVVVKDKDSPVDEHDEVNAASCCV